MGCRVAVRFPSSPPGAVAAAPRRARRLGSGFSTGVSAGEAATSSPRPLGCSPGCARPRLAPDPASPASPAPGLGTPGGEIHLGGRAAGAEWRGGGGRGGGRSAAGRKRGTQVAKTNGRRGEALLRINAVPAERNVFERAARRANRGVAAGDEEHRLPSACATGKTIFV